MPDETGGTEANLPAAVLEPPANIHVVARAPWGSMVETFGGMPVVPRFVGRYLFVPVLGFGMAWAEMFHGGYPRARSLLFWAALAANATGLAAIVVPVALFVLWVWWHLSVKNWFTGPKNTIDMLPEQVATQD